MSVFRQCSTNQKVLDSCNNHLILCLKIFNAKIGWLFVVNWLTSVPAWEINQQMILKLIPAIWSCNKTSLHTGHKF